MKKTFLAFLTACLLVAAIPPQAEPVAALQVQAQVKEAHQGTIFSVAEASGIVTVSYPVKETVKTKLMIEKDEEKRTYDLNPAVKSDRFPLQLGNGEYKITILENVTDNKYKVIEKETFTLTMEDTNQVFLGSVQNVNWDESMEVIQVARKLTKDIELDLDKVRVIHQYIIERIEYDYAKAEFVAYNYLPDLQQVFEQGKGICYDYSSLLAAMLRSVGLPTKLVMGQSAFVEQYHAWNEVYLRETGEWITVDPTVDTGWLRNQTPFTMIKDPDDYKTRYEY